MPILLSWSGKVGYQQKIEFKTVFRNLHLSHQA